MGHSKKEIQLTTLGKSPLHDTGCWRQWLKESSYCCIPVVEHVFSVYTDITISTEEWLWPAVTTTDSSWTAATLLADLSCRILLCHHGIHQTGSLFLPPH